MCSSEQTQKQSGVTALVVAALLFWLTLVLFLGARGDFIGAQRIWPLPILVGVTAPLLVFFAACGTWHAFRDFVLTIDLRLVTAIQAWRFVGLGLLALYTYGVLPGRFAWSAGLGDMAIGLTAPWIVLALIRLPGFAASQFFVVWNLLGILDLAVAVSMGALSSGQGTGAATEIMTAPMAQMPLVLVPAYFVPLFVMLHLAALFQARLLRQSECAGERASQGAVAVPAI